MTSVEIVIVSLRRGHVRDTLSTDNTINFLLQWEYEYHLSHLHDYWLVGGPHEVRYDKIKSKEIIHHDAMGS